ncbi:MAG TPA: hypothetical protein VF763_14910 [Candidatus Limnocylindrales bacterium]
MLAVGALGLGLVLAACSGSTTSSTSAPQSQATPSAAAPSATPAASSSPGLIGSFALPSFTGDKALEARLPHQIGGTTLQVVSFSGQEMLASGDQTTKPFTDLLQQLGKSPSDVSFALAADPSGKVQVVIAALKVAGADSNQVAQRFVSESQAQASGATVTQATVGGKAVTKVVEGGSPNATYVYPSGDVMFMVQAPSDDVAGQALSAIS